MSSFSSLSLPTLRRRAFCSTCVRRTLQQPLLEALLVRAALGRRDDVHERARRRCRSRCPSAARCRRGTRARPRSAPSRPVGCSTGTVSVNVPLPVRRQVSVMAASGREVLGELRDAAVEVERGLVVRLVAALVADDDLEPGHEERGLAGAARELLELERGVLREDLPVGPVADAGAGDALGDLADDAQLAAHLERRERRVRRGRARVGEDAGLAAVERHRPGLAVAVDLDVEPLGQRVDDGGADAVQTAGCRVRAAAELAAGVQLREDDLDAATARSWARCRPGCRGRCRAPRRCRRRAG